MQLAENTTFYYLVTRYPDGRIWYEGYSHEEDTLKRIEETNRFNEACGDPVRSEYVGTKLPADVAAYAHQKDLEFTERDFHMQPLQGSDKQVAWARDIRYRFAIYLQDKDNVNVAKARYQSEESKQLQAKWWIDNRYALAVTKQASMYVAEGRAWNK